MTRGSRAMCARFTWAIALMSWLAAAIAHAEPSYDQLIEQAVRAQAFGDFVGAHGLFAQAPNARTLRGMGVTSYKAGQFVDALHELEAALVHPPRQLERDALAGSEQSLSLTLGEADAPVAQLATQPALRPPQRSELPVDVAADHVTRDGIGPGANAAIGSKTGQAAP